MTTLANHAFVKMNGLGNEIVVVDLRRETGAVNAEEARAAAAGSQQRWSSLGAGQARSVGHIRRQQADCI